MKKTVLLTLSCLMLLSTVGLAQVADTWRGARVPASAQETIMLGLTVRDSETNDLISGFDFSAVRGDGFELVEYVPTSYYYPSLPVGNYTITISAEGYEDKIIQVEASTAEDGFIDLGTVFLTPVSALEEASLSGMIHTSEGVGIPGVYVELSGIVEGYTANLTTDADGAYRFTGLPLDAYQISISAAGYHSSTRTVSIDEVEDKILNIRMNAVAPPDLTITPLAPENVRTSVLEDGSIKVEWNAVTRGRNVNLNQVNLENPELVTYDVIYYGGEISSSDPEIVSADGNLSFTVAAFSTLNVYTFAVKASHKEVESANSSSVYVLNKSIENSQVVVADVNSIATHSVDYPFVSNDFYASDVSGISQTVYSVESMGGTPFNINELTFFLPQAIDAQLNYKISLGYKDSDSFGGVSDFVPQELLQEVYDGEIDFNSQVITIPIAEFYYDATKPLVVQWLKPLDGKAGISVYVNTPPAGVDLNKTITIKSTTVDFSELADFSDVRDGRYARTGAAALVINTSEYVSIGSDLSSSTVKILSNPSSDGRFYLDLPSSSKVDVFNVSGVLLASEVFESEGIHEINLSSQSRGVYFLRVNSNNTVQTIKALYK